MKSAPRGALITPQSKYICRIVKKTPLKVLQLKNKPYLCTAIRKQDASQLVFRGVAQSG